MGHLAHNHFFFRLFHSGPVDICMSISACLYANETPHIILVWLLSVFTNMETFVSSLTEHNLMAAHIEQSSCGLSVC